LPKQIALGIGEEPLKKKKEKKLGSVFGVAFFYKIENNSCLVLLVLLVLLVTSMKVLKK